MLNSALWYGWLNLVLAISLSVLNQGTGFVNLVGTVTVLKKLVVDV